jgi:serine/threonine protein kinase
MVDRAASALERANYLPVNKNTGDPIQGTLTNAELGGGSFGTTYRCTKQFGGTHVAVKLVDLLALDKRSKTARGKAVKEANTLSAITASNPAHIAKSHNAVEDKDNDMLVIEMELCGPTLEEVWNKYGNNFTTEQIANYLGQAAKGFGELKKNDYIHRDFKMDNVCTAIDDEKTLKLIDLGLATLADQGNSMLKTKQLATLQVTRGEEKYMSPEMMEDGEKIGCENDMYSLGLVLYEMLLGEWLRAPPYDSRVKLRNKSTLKMMVALAKEKNHKLGTIVRRLLEVKPAKRFTPDQVDCALRLTPGEYLYQVFKDSDLDGIFVPGEMPDAERLTLEEAIKPVTEAHRHLKNDVKRAQVIPEAARSSEVPVEYKKALGFYTIGKNTYFLLSILHEHTFSSQPSRHSIACTMSLHRLHYVIHVSR